MELRQETLAAQARAFTARTQQPEIHGMWFVGILSGALRLCVLETTMNILGVPSFQDVTHARGRFGGLSGPQHLHAYNYIYIHIDAYQYIQVLTYTWRCPQAKIARLWCFTFFWEDHCNIMF